MTIKSSLGNLDPVKWAIRLSLFAAGIAIWVKSGGPVTGYEPVLFALAIGFAALMFEYQAAKKMTNGWFDRAPAAVLGWGLIWAGAFTYSCNNWLGAAAEGESAKATAQKAAFVQFGDVRSDLAAAKKELDRLEERMKLAPTRNAEAAEAAIQNAKANRFWTITSGCMQTKGAQTREFCSGYASAVADKAMATEMLVVREDHKAAKARYEQAKAAAAATKATASATRSDLRIFIKYMHMDAETAEDVQSWLKIGVISLFVTLAAIMGVIEDRKNTPRQPWFRWRSALANMRAAWDGKGIERIEVTKTYVQPSGHSVAFGK